MNTLWFNTHWYTAWSDSNQSFIIWVTDVNQWTTWLLMNMITEFLIRNLQKYIWIKPESPKHAPMPASLVVQTFESRSSGKDCIWGCFWILSAHSSVSIVWNSANCKNWDIAWGGSYRLIHIQYKLIFCLENQLQYWWKRMIIFKSDIWYCSPHPERTTVSILWLESLHG